MTTATQTKTAGRDIESYATRPAPATVRFERLLPGPIEQVWSYLTDSDKRAKWFAGGPMELRDGGELTLTFRNSDLSGGQPNPYEEKPSANGVDHVLEGVIVACEPPHLLVFNWSRDGSGSEARFELTQDGANTRLILIHSRIASHGQLLGVSAGWHTHIGILLDLLAGDATRSFWPEHVRLRKVYADRFPE